MAVKLSHRVGDHLHVVPTEEPEPQIDPEKGVAGPGMKLPHFW